MKLTARFTLRLDADWNEQLRRFAKENRWSKGEAARALIEDGLKQRGFIPKKRNGIR